MSPSEQWIILFYSKELLHKAVGTFRSERSASQYAERVGAARGWMYLTVSMEKRNIYREGEAV